MGNTWGDSGGGDDDDDGDDNDDDDDDNADSFTRLWVHFVRLVPMMTLWAGEPVHTPAHTHCALHQNFSLLILDDSDDSDDNVQQMIKHRWRQSRCSQV